MDGWMHACILRLEGVGQDRNAAATIPRYTIRSVMLLPAYINIYIQAQRHTHLESPSTNTLEKTTHA